MTYKFKVTNDFSVYRKTYRIVINCNYHVKELLATLNYLLSHMPSCFFKLSDMVLHYCHVTLLGKKYDHNELLKTPNQSASTLKTNQKG